jgi:large subunit ribosomal protein L31e
MADEKIFTIPLRDAWDTPRTRRSKAAITIVRAFLKRHMKSEDVKIGASINEAVWARGIQKPARRVKVHVLKQDGTVFAELVGVEIKPPTAAEAKKKEEKKAEKEKRIKEERKERKKLTMEKEIKEEKAAAERAREEIKEEKATEAKPEEKK